MFFKRKIDCLLTAVILCMSIILFTNCVSTESVKKQNEKVNVADSSKKESENVLGFGILSRIPGQWNGELR